MGRPLPTLLDQALREQRVAPLFRELTVGRFGAGAEVRGVTVAVVQRRLVRYTVAATPPDDEAQPAFVLIGKVYDDEAVGRREFEALRRLNELGFPAALPTSVSVPVAHAWIPELKLLLMQEIGGRPLKMLVKQRRARPVHMHRFAHALAKLHRFPPIVDVPYTLDDHLTQRCAGQCGTLAAAFPDLAGEIDAIIAAARELQGGARALAHGDWHLGQLHLDGPTSWILDLEQLRLGDPAYDLALAVMQFARLALPERSASYVRTLRDAFLGCYFAKADLQIAARIPMNVALALLKRACKRVRWQDEHNWQVAVRAQIRQDAACIALQRRLRPPRTVYEVIALCARCPATA